MDEEPRGTLEGEGLRLDWEPILTTYAKEALSLDTEFRQTVTRCAESVSARDLQIVETYWGLIGGERQTLETIGTRLGITRERVRQLHGRAAGRIRDAFIRCEPPSAVLLRALLASRGGFTDTPSLVTQLNRLVPSGAYRAAPYVDLLLSLDALPGLRLFLPKLLVDQSVNLLNVEAAMKAMTAAMQATSGTFFDDLVTAAEGFLESDDDEGLEDQVRCLASLVGSEVLPGLYSSRAWKREDYAQFVLEQHGSPLHFSEVTRRAAELAGKNFQAAGFNGLLNGSPLFVRVGAGDFALAKWGPRRYGRFDEVIERYLASGRIAEHIDTIKGELLRQYTVAESTVQAMMALERETFCYYGGGYWGLKGYAPVLEPELVKEVQKVLAGSPEALSASEVERKVAEEPSTAGYPNREVARVLYVSPRFRRIGGPTRRRFLLADSI